MNYVDSHAFVNLCCKFCSGSGLGDPHFMTLDGVFYTFNGVGEYVLVRSKVNDLKFQLQGRTTAIMNSGATVFSAFAVESNETNFQVVSAYIPPVVQ